MADVHLADVPGHIGGRKGDVEASGKALSVDVVDVLNPNGHPDAFVACLVAVGAEGKRVGSLPATTLCTLTKKELGNARANGTKSRRFTPIPEFPPTKLLKPGKAPFYIGNAENRSDMFGVHGGELYIFRHRRNRGR